MNKHLLNNWTFAIEAKATGKKLSGIENATLREHREKFGAKFTILMIKKANVQSGPTPKTRRCSGENPRV